MPIRSVLVPYDVEMNSIASKFLNTVRQNVVKFSKLVILCFIETKTDKIRNFEMYAFVGITTNFIPIV